MKKILLVVVLAIVALGANAQMRPVQGDCGFTFGLSGLQNVGVNSNVIPTGTLLFRYYISDDMAIRAGINFSTSSITSEFNDSVGPMGFRSYESDEITAKASSWGINLGIQKSLGDNEKLEPYVAADLWVGGGRSFSNAKMDTSMNNTAANSTSLYTSTTEPGSSFSFGLTPTVGFNWFLFDHFAIGAEFGWGLGISSTPAGTFSSSSTSTVTVGNTTTTTTTTASGTTSSSKGMSLGTHGSGMITCSVFFGGK